jgi:IclR family KDG regulon transcriptional repressor
MNLADRVNASGAHSISSPGDRFMPKMAAVKEVPHKPGRGVYTVPAVKKAFKIIEMMASHNRGYNLSSVARECGLPVSTANVLLHSLCECGYLQRSENGSFSLTTKLFTEGNKLIRQVQLYDIAFPEMQRLSRVTDFSVNLAIPDRMELIYVRIIQGRGDIQVQSHVGQRRSFHQAATGKVMLAFFPEERIKEFAEASGLPAVTKQTITSYRQLQKELESIRTQGFAIDNEESGKNLWGVATPIFDHQRNVVAALGVAGTNLSPTENVKFLITETRKSALAVSRALGYEPPAAVRNTVIRMEGKAR